MAYINDKNSTLIEARAPCVLYKIFRALRYMDLNEEKPMNMDEELLTLELKKELDGIKHKPNYLRIREFWGLLCEDDKKELWLKHFTSFDRTALWDALPFTTDQLVEDHVA